MLLCFLVVHSTTIQYFFCAINGFIWMKKVNLKLVKLAISGHFHKSSILQGRMVKIGRFKGFTSKEQIGSSEVPG